MKKYLQVMQRAPLFAGVSEAEMDDVFACLDARLRVYAKGEAVFRRGEQIRDITVLASGKLHIQREDYWGNNNIISAIDVGEMFGEAYLAPGSGGIGNNVIAAENSEVMFFDARKIITPCPHACRFHAQVVRNLLYAISEKNKKLVQKLGHMSNRTTREKLMSYLSEESQRQGSASFAIPFNRQQLADYLSVERSAMSAELGKMRAAGLIAFDRNRFTLLAMK